MQEDCGEAFDNVIVPAWAFACQVRKVAFCGLNGARRGVRRPWLRATKGLSVLGSDLGPCWWDNARRVEMTRRRILGNRHRDAPGHQRSRVIVAWSRLSGPHGRSPDATITGSHNASPKSLGGAVSIPGTTSISESGDMSAAQQEPSSSGGLWA